ncbi:MAG: Spy/CpxP family protein refolding chaperone [Acidobacteriota bacterium]|nr:Spy/CpxP family protein refolding chaperone [Acidobacteriota bacterium]
MKLVVGTALALLVAIPLLILAQEQRSPYVGQEVRDIKSLSDAEVQGYLQGRGMGLAKPAELNGYPGPMHVLELSQQLQLTDDQRAATQRSFERMRAEAVRLGRLFVEKEAELNRLFGDVRADSGNLQRLVGETARLQGELRLSHLRAHLEMRSILTPQQITRYNELRGYGTGDAPHQRHGHQ